jgi:hypothetical protein
MFPKSPALKTGGRAAPLSRLAMAAALAIGAAVIPGSPALAQQKPAKEAPPKLSPAFTKIAGPLQNALGAAQKAKPDAAGIAALKAQSESALAVASSRSRPASWTMTRRCSARRSNRSYRRASRRAQTSASTSSSLVRA